MLTLTRRLDGGGDALLPTDEEGGWGARGGTLLVSPFKVTSTVELSHNASDACNKEEEGLGGREFRGLVGSWVVDASFSPAETFRLKVGERKPPMGCSEGTVSA